jgi:hypothetical protein
LRLADERCSTVRPESNAENRDSPGRPKNQTACQLAGEDDRWLQLRGTFLDALERIAEVHHQLRPAVR